MPSKKQKAQALKKLQPEVYQIHGIFNFKIKKLVFVSLDIEEVEFKFELGDYNEDFDIVSFNVALH